MSETKWCGNDSRGNSIDKNDLPNILNLYQGKKITRENSSQVKDISLNKKILEISFLHPDTMIKNLLRYYLN